MFFGRPGAFHFKTGPLRNFLFCCTAMIRVLDKRLLLGLGLIAIVLFLNAILDYRNTRELNADLDWVAHFRAVHESLDAILLAVVDAETGQRGYLLTADEHYLEPYNAALDALPDLTRRIQSLTTDDPQFQKHVQDLLSLISAKLTELRQTRELRKENPQEATRIVLGGAGKALMDSIRRQILDMKEEERNLIAVHQRKAKTTYLTALRTGLLTGIVGMGMVLAFGLMWWRDAQVRTRDNALLHEQREWFRMTLSSIGDAVIAADPDGKIRFMNGIAESLTGWPEEKARGLQLGEVFRIIDEQNREPVDDPVGKIMRTGRITGLANYSMLVTRSGDLLSIADSGTPIHDAEGRISGVVLVFRDVSREKQAKRIDRLLASIVESSDDAIYAKTLDGTIRSWNSGAERVYGYPAEEAIGKNVSMLVPPEMPNEVPGMLQKIGEGVRIAHYETVRIRKDGSRVHVSMSLSPLWDGEGKVMGASSLARDITDRKLAEEALKRTAEELDRSNKELEQFAYVASHDMQEPLRTITGYLQLLSARYKGQIDEKADRYIAYAVEGAERMSTLIRDLLSYSRVNTRGGEFQPTDSGESLEFAIRNLRSAIDQSQATITHDPLPLLEADKTQLVQLFQNLIGNAIKYRSPERNPRIHVSARRENSAWHFDVQDNGIGFEQQYESKMFLIFQRLHSRGKYPGTGIGLAICKRIVDRHGGRIWAAGEPGHGAKFSFTIPTQRES